MKVLLVLAIGAGTILVLAVASILPPQLTQNPPESEITVPPKPSPNNSTPDTDNLKEDTLINTECDDYSSEGHYQYQLIEPTEYFITVGEFRSLCAEPNYLWFNIELETQEPGSLTITIPKDKLDLKQFDYDSCYPYKLTINSQQSDNVKVKQISQTTQSRTLEFTWLMPVSNIVYSGAYWIVDDVVYSEPQQCVGLVEGGYRNAEIKIRSFDYKSCETEINLNYTIAKGAVQKICYDPAISYFSVWFEGIDSINEFSIEIPYSYIPPHTSYNSFALELDFPTWYLHKPSINIINQTNNSQILNIDLPPHVDYIETYFNVFVPSNTWSDLAKVAEYYENLEYPNKCDGSSIFVPKSYNTFVCVHPSIIEKIILDYDPASVDSTNQRIIEKFESDYKSFQCDADQILMYDFDLSSLMCG